MHRRLSELPAVFFCTAAALGTDDFIAVGQWLIDNRMTLPHHLAIQADFYNLGVTPNYGFP